MSSDTRTLPAGVAATLEDHVDAAIDEATEEPVLFHLRHAKQLLVDLEASADAQESSGDQRQSDAA